jgi:hypothetical protein
MTAQDYVAEREITPEEISQWHLDVCVDHLGYPLLTVAGVYCCTIKRMFIGEQKYEYPKDYPIHIHLFGINKALPAIQEHGFAFAVEGPLDCMAMHRIGAKNTVAYLGNHLTKWQALSLARWTDKLVVIPDGDAGGRGGLEKTRENVGKLLTMGTINLPPGFDPDKLSRLKSGEEIARFQALIQKLMQANHG